MYVLLLSRVARILSYGTRGEVECAVLLQGASRRGGKGCELQLRLDEQT